MKSRERLLSALKHESVDRLPWTALATAYYWQSLPDPFSDQLDNLVSLLKYVGADVLDLCFDAPATVVDPRVEVIKEARGHAVETTLQTPIGSVSEVRQSEPEAGTAFRTEFLIKDVEDCGIMEYTYRQKEYEPDFRAARKRIDNLGDDGLVAYFGIRSPLPMLLEELAGLETGILLLNDYPETFESLLDAIHIKNMELYQIVAESPFEFAIGVEDTSTTMISPRMFKQYVMPYLNDYAEILHSGNKIHGVHMCGHLKGLLSMLRELDVDGLESVTPPPTGNLELPEAMRALGDKLFIIGGLDAPSIQHQSPEGVDQCVRRLLSEIPSQEGLILEVTDDVSPNTPLENLKAVGQAILAYGQ
jgi:uroporphyrinogen-III decarboxylase